MWVAALLGNDLVDNTHEISFSFIVNIYLYRWFEFMCFLYKFNGVNVINYFSIYGYHFCYNKIISKIYLNISLFFIYYLWYVWLFFFSFYIGILIVEAPATSTSTYNSMTNLSCCCSKRSIIVSTFRSGSTKIFLVYSNISHLSDCCRAVFGYQTDLPRR